MDTNTIIEINGVKLEVDLRTAKRVETMRVGSKVKLLCKNDYNGIKVVPGVVVGFEPFESLPTIIVAYVELGYNEAAVKLAYINGSKPSTDKWEMVPANDDDLPIQKAAVLKNIDREIAKKEAEIADINAKREYFLANFGAYFAAEPAEVS